MTRKRKLAASLLAILCCDEESEKKRRCIWVKPWIARKHLGIGENLMRELAFEDPDSYRRWLRLDVSTFQSLVERLTPFIGKQDTVMREAIKVETKLAVCLRYLATGETYDSLHRQFRLGKNTVSLLVPEVCEAIYKILKDEYVTVPQTECEWKNIAQQFWEFWQFPNCIGALDGKHVVVEAPPKSGSYYFNYKGTFSIVLMALVDADYQFIYIDVGTNGRVCDSGVWGKCAMKQAIENGRLSIPSDSCPPGSSTPLPYVIVGDQGFGLKPYLLRPFPDCKSIANEKRVFNYRLCRARRTSENAFGILSSRFQVFRCPMRLMNIENVSKVVLAAVALHNFLRKNASSRQKYSPPSSVEREDLVTGEIRQADWQKLGDPTGMRPLNRVGAGNHGSKAEIIRESFMNYFHTEAGSVSWQWGNLTA